jgi:hypothetical protein
MAAVPKDFVWPRIPAQGSFDIPFLNTSAAQLTPGQIVKLDTAHPLSPTQLAPGMVLSAAVTDVPDGVVVQDTPIGVTGTIQVGGFATVFQDSGGNIAAGALAGPSAAVAGAATTATATAGDGVVGKAWSAGTATADPIGVRLTCGTY